MEPYCYCRTDFDILHLYLNAQPKACSSDWHYILFHSLVFLCFFAACRPVRAFLVPYFEPCVISVDASGFHYPYILHHMIHIIKLWLTVTVDCCNYFHLAIIFLWQYQCKKHYLSISNIV